MSSGVIRDTAEYVQIKNHIIPNNWNCVSMMN